MGRRRVLKPVKTRTLTPTLEEAGRLSQVLFWRYVIPARDVPVAVVMQMLRRMVASSQQIDIARARHEIKRHVKRRRMRGGFY